MKTLVTRLVMTTIVATCVFASTQVRAQEQVTQKPRVDFRFNADQPTSLHAPLLTAARPTAVRAQKVPHRKMSTGARMAIGAAIGLGAGFIYLGASGCAVPDIALPGETHEQNDYNQCNWGFFGMIGGGAAIGYVSGR